MSRLATAPLVLLAAWLGAALLTAAVVAPAAFRVLSSRTLAGAVVGQVLPVIFVSGLVIGIIAWGLDARMARAGLGMSWAPYLVMIAGCAVAQFVVAPKIETARSSIDGAVDSVDATDPRRVAFGRLHGISVLCMGVAMLGAATSVGLKIPQSKS